MECPSIGELLALDGEQMVWGERSERPLVDAQSERSVDARN